VREVEKFLKIFSVVLAVAVAAFLFLAYRSDSAKMQAKAEELTKIQEQRNIEAEEKEAAEKIRLEKVANSLPRIVCWGDGLTAGYNGEGVTYPDTLANLIKLKVLNYGAGGETTQQIAYRQGGRKFYTDAFVMPGTVSSVEIKLINENGEGVNLLSDGFQGINPCTIDGVKGEISKEGDIYYFIRKEAGTEKNVPARTQVFTSAMLDQKSDDIVIIFSGSDDPSSEDRANNIIANQRAMLDYAGVSKFIIVGLTRKSDEAVNNALSAEYGNKYYDWRKYLMENALTDAEITPTEQDKADLNNGIVPTSLRTADVLGNWIYYEQLGKQMYKKILELGYLTQEQKEYLGIK
jgi:hypothetical protein